MIRNDDLRRRGGGSKGTGYLNFTGHSHGGRDKYGNDKYANDSSGQRSIHLSDKIGGRFGKNRTLVESGGIVDDAASQASQSKMIRQTTTWEVRSEGEQ